MTHTYALLELTPASYDEIAVKLRVAGYQHAFDHDEPGTPIDMHGIGVSRLDIVDACSDLAKFRAFWESIGGHIITEGLAQIASIRVERLLAALWSRHETGWVIEDGQPAPRTCYRTMNQYGLAAWTTDFDQSLRFARRQDAEAFCRQDENAWHIREHQWIPKAHTLSDEVPTAIDDSIAQPEDAYMLLTISKTGTKRDVIEQVQAETSITPLPHVETVIRRAIAHHIQEFADPGIPVSVTASISLSYAANLDTDGKEISVHKAHGKQSAADAAATAANAQTAREEYPKDVTGRSALDTEDPI